MQDVTEMWLRLICDVVTNRQIVGNASLSNLSLPDPSLDLREEIFKFLSSLPYEGNLFMLLQYKTTFFSECIVIIC